MNTDKQLFQIFAACPDWLEQRFPQKGKREIEMMLLGELPELEETQSAKDLIRIGEKRGEKRGADLLLDRMVLSVPKSKFGVLPKSVQAHILALPRSDKEQFLNFVAICDSLPKLKNWLDGHAN